MASCYSIIYCLGKKEWFSQLELGCSQNQEKRRDVEFEYILFSTMPRTGNTYARKLLENATGIVTESVFKEDGKINRRTGAWARKCGGIPLQSRQGKGKGHTYNCRHIRRSQGEMPVFVKSHSPVDMGSAAKGDLSIVEQLRIEKRKATCFLLIVRNPIDAYAAELRFLSKDVQTFSKSMGSGGKLPSNIPLTFRGFMRHKFLRYLNYWGRRVHERKVSTFLLRLEDLVENPALAVRSILKCFGVQNLFAQDADLKVFVNKVRSSGASSSTAAQGSGFELVMKLAPKWYRELHNYEDVLEKFGYSYFRGSGREEFGEKPQLGLKVINLTETASWD